MKQTHNTTVVVADDDPQFLRLMTSNLKLEGYKVLLATGGQQALDHVAMSKPDLVILDVMMPKLDSLSVCQHIRESSSIPIICLFKDGQDQMKIQALDLGADDCLTKPFNTDELLARIRALLRRTRLTMRARLTTCEHIRALSQREATTIGDLTVDYSQYTVTMAGREVELTPIEFCLIATLTQHARQVVPQEILLESAWGKKHIGENHLLQVHIHRLRRKLEVDPKHPRYILTRTDIGYLLREP